MIINDYLHDSGMTKAITMNEALACPAPSGRELSTQLTEGARGINDYVS
ncbi:MAG: hypothetical protein KBT31_04845 [Firmicutes bacterium]|nr:hypothetical protein [Candidatus Colimorpha enterica]